MASMLNMIKAGASVALDFALPPRCSACGLIISDIHSFCPDCWKSLTFLGTGGCESCGLPLAATEAEQCAACLAAPLKIERMRAAVAYDDLSTGIALRFKYGRKVALARTMARFMAPLLRPASGDEILVPVPLHRLRLWQRGFNQSLLVATALSASTGIGVERNLLRRTKRTPPLKGMSLSQRRRAVGGAFKVEGGEAVKGRTVILVDDVLTTGSTAEACAGVLRRAGASRVELISWARVVRPRQLMR